MRVVLIGVLAALATAGAGAPAWAQEPSKAEAEAAAARLTGLLSLMKPELVAAGAPTIAPGPVATKEAILSAPVAFGVTGTVQEELRGLGSMDKYVMVKAGAPVFGVVRGSLGTGPMRIWCRLEQIPLNPPPPGGTPSEEKVWATTCLPPSLKGQYHVTSREDLLGRRIEWSPYQTMEITRVKVTEGPVPPGPPMTLVYELRDFDRKDIDIDLYLQVGDQKSWVGLLELPRAEDGSGTLTAGGAVVRIAQNGKDRRSTLVEVLKPAVAGDPSLTLGPMR